MRPLLPVVILAAATSVAHAGFPAVSVRDVSVSGKVDAKAVTATLNKVNPKLRDCYQQELAANPGTDADIEVTFSIEANGTVATATVPAPTTTLSTCIARALSKLTFTKPKDRMPAGVSMRMRFVSDTLKTGAFASIEGSPGVYGGLTGNSIGGGGTGLGTIGTGTTGLGTGTGTGFGTGTGQPSSNVATLGAHKVSGDLDPLLVRRYVKRQINRFAYCYEKELAVSPKIAGTLTLEFTISGVGTVSAAKARGVHANVESCVTTLIKSIEFPKPKNAADVTVTYPITFKPAK